MQILAFVTLLAAVTPDAVEQVRQAEIGFAKAFADRDQVKFFSYVPNDTTFMSGRGTLRGKPEMMRVWSTFFKEPKAPFSWGPDRVVVSGDGKLGFSNGSIYDAEGKHAGFFISTWRKEPDGKWMVVFDGPGFPPPTLTEPDRGVVAGEGGLKLNYRKTGEGRLALIVPFDLPLFENLRQFGDMATIITYERGEQDVIDLEALRAHLKLDRFVLVGTADSAGVVAKYAAEHPDRVTRVVQFGATRIGDAPRLAMPVLIIERAGGGGAWAASLPDARIVTGANDPVTIFGSIRAFLRDEWPMGSQPVSAAAATGHASRPTAPEPAGSAPRSPQ